MPPIFNRFQIISLTKLFLSALANGPTKPRAIILINDAVELSIEGSPVISELTVLAEQGVQVHSCLSSLDEIEAEEKIAVGSQADMANMPLTFIPPGHFFPTAPREEQSIFIVHLIRLPRYTLSQEASLISPFLVCMQQEREVDSLPLSIRLLSSV